jgi:hypothetical protein
MSQVDSVKLATLAAEFEDLCLEVAESLMQHQIYSGMQSIEQIGIQLVTGIRDEKQVAIPFTNSVLQKPSSTFNPVTDAIDFIPRKWKMRPWAVDLMFKLRDFNATFLQHYKSASRQIQESLDLTEFMLRMILKQLTEDLELAIWQGEYDPAAAAANLAEPLKVVDGFLKLTTDAIAAGDIVPVVTGAITSANAVDAFKAMYYGLTNKTKGTVSFTYASYTNVLAYIENYTQNNSANNIITSYIFQEWLSNQKNRNAQDLRNFELQTGNFLPMIPLPESAGNNFIVPVWGMGDTNRLIIESRHNGGVMKVGMGDENDTVNLDSFLDKPDRSLKVIMDGSIACQIACFEINSEVYYTANDVA